MMRMISYQYHASMLVWVWLLLLGNSLTVYHKALGFEAAFMLPHLSTRSRSSTTRVVLSSGAVAPLSSNSTVDRNSRNDHALEQDNTRLHHQRQTCALLKISYDGARFSGWSASGDTSPPNQSMTMTRPKDAPRSGNRRRNYRIHALNSGQPRSVEGVVRANLAKVYGNMDPDHIVVEGCSRLDKGVHATALVALIYGLSTKDRGSFSQGRSIEGKKLPHPRNSTDETCFMPLPMSIDKLGYTMK